MGLFTKTIGLTAVLITLAVSAVAQCRADRLDIRGDWGQAGFTVELALTPEDQATGLMFRESMARMAGMLFVFDRSRPTAFWMRNTLIPLDMLFIDETGTVTRIHENAIPEDETSIPSGGPVLAVLEINGGMSELLGITEGSQIRHPNMPQDTAIWPCDTE